jgi:hypothetical protein
MEDLQLYTGVLALASVFLVLWLVKCLIASESEKSSLQNMLISLLSRYSNRDNILAKYIFDTKLGVYKHKLNGHYYCHKCFVEKTQESQLEAQKEGLSCPACGSFYRNPDIKVS